MVATLRASTLSRKGTASGPEISTGFSGVSKINAF
jgi:hypothetical protein